MSTATQPLVVPRSGALTLARDYAELAKLRVTSLIIVTAWCGYYFGALKSGVSSLSWSLFHTLLGIGLVSGGATRQSWPGRRRYGTASGARLRSAGGAGLVRQEYHAD